jgi:hypothetical protein
MSAVISALVVLAAALVAGLSTQVTQGWPSYAAEQPSEVAQSETVPDDKLEQKRDHKQADKRSVKREQKQSEPACAQPCPAAWPRYELAPWPL